MPKKWGRGRSRGKLLAVGRIKSFAVALLAPVVVSACTTTVYEAAPRTSTTTSRAPTSQPIPATTPTSTSTLATPPPSTTPPVPTTTIPVCTGEVVTVLPGEPQTLAFDNIPHPDAPYDVVVRSLLYNERSDPITNIHVTFNYVTELAGTGTGEASTLMFTSIGSEGSTAWTSDVSSPSPVTSVTITSISYMDVAAGPGCGLQTQP
jgi:hypothetical protein